VDSCGTGLTLRCGSTHSFRVLLWVLNTFWLDTRLLPALLLTRTCYPFPLPTTPPAFSATPYLPHLPPLLHSADVTPHALRHDTFQHFHHSGKQRYHRTTAWTYVCRPTPLNYILPLRYVTLQHLPQPACAAPFLPPLRPNTHTRTRAAPHLPPTHPTTPHTPAIPHIRLLRHIPRLYARCITAHWHAYMTTLACDSPTRTPAPCHIAHPMADVDVDTFDGTHATRWNPTPPAFLPAITL